MAQYVGRVVGTKMMKTAKVSVNRLALHPVIKKVRTWWCAPFGVPGSSFTFSVLQQEEDVLCS